MKKSMVLLAALLLLTVGATWAQDKLVRYDEKAFDKLAKKMNEDKDNPYVVSWAKDVFRSYCESQFVEFSEKDIKDTLRAKAAIEKEYNKLLKAKMDDDAEITTLKEKNKKAEADLKRQNDVVDSLNRVIANKNKEIEGAIDSVNREKLELESKVAQYEKAFETVKGTITGIYDNNMDLSLREMKVSQLAEAESAWTGMKDLLESANPILAKELKTKVDVINMWKKAVEPIQGAVAYMKGKYDNKQRLAWQKELGNLSLDGNKAKERDEVLTALKDQEAIKDNFDKIMRNLEKDVVCLPDKEQMNEAKGMIDRMRSQVKNQYHPYYASYDAAFMKIEDELNKKGPSDRVVTPENFKKFINELREMF